MHVLTIPAAAPALAMKPAHLLDALEAPEQLIGPPL
jgi:hypothetical protein